MAATPRRPDGSPLDRLARASRSHRRRRQAVRFLSLLTRLATPGVVVLLTLVFLSKALWPWLVYGALALPVWVGAVAVFVLLKRERWTIPAWQSRALADLRSGSRGTFMALEEGAAREWTDRLGRADAPLTVGFPWRQSMRWVATAAVLAIVLMLPDLRPQQSQVEAATAPIDRMEEMVAELREEDVADEAYLQEAEKLLREMKEETTQSLKAEDWQALDGFREDVRRQLLDSQRRLQETQTQLSDLQAAVRKSRNPDADQLKQMAERLAKQAPQAASQASESAAQEAGMDAGEMEALLGKCRAGNFSFSPKEMAMLRSMAKSSPLSAEQLKQLAELFKDMDMEKLAAMAKSMELGKLTLEEMEALLKKCKGGFCKFSDEEMKKLKAMLAAAKGECLGKEGFCAGMLAKSGVPGRGGVGRGRGDANIYGAGDTPMDFGEFETEAFTGNQSDDLVPLGFGFAPPDLSDVADGVGDGPGAAVQFGRGNERITWHSRLQPRHNDVMKDYFSEPE